MPAPLLSSKIMSSVVRNNLAKAKAVLEKERKMSLARGSSDSQPKHRKKKTLTPDRADSIVRDVKVSADGNEVKLLFELDPAQTPTAQQKGAFVGKDGQVHFFTKAKVAKAEKALMKAIAPYASHSRRWGRVPIEVSFLFMFSYASGTPKKNRHKIGPMLERPDVDNIVKLYLDCMTQTGYWEDDSLVNNLLLRKRRTTGPECITIRIVNLQPKFEALYAETSEYYSPSLFSNTSSTPAKPSETNPLAEFKNS